MRFLDSNSMLCMLPAETRIEAIALERLNPLFSRHGGDVRRLPELTRQGTLRTAQVNYKGAPAYVVWFSIERDRLIIDTMTAVSAHAHSLTEFCDVLWSGVETLAHTYGCKSVEGVTARAALVRLYENNGFEARGVLMRKEFLN